MSGTAPTSSGSQVEIEDQYLCPLSVLDALPNLPPLEIHQYYVPRNPELIKVLVGIVNRLNTHPSKTTLEAPNELPDGVVLNRCRVRFTTTPNGQTFCRFTAKTNRRPARVELETLIDEELAEMLIETSTTKGYLKKRRYRHEGTLGDSTKIVMAIDSILEIGFDGDDVSDLPFVFCEVEVPKINDIERLSDQSVACSLRWVFNQGVRMVPGDATYKYLAMSRMARGHSDKFWKAVDRAKAALQARALEIHSL